MKKIISMHQSVLIKLTLYRGGEGVIQTKEGRTRLKEIKVDNDKEIVSGMKQEIKIGFDEIVSKDGATHTLDTREVSFEISFDDIIGFVGEKIA